MYPLHRSLSLSIYICIVSSTHIVLLCIPQKGGLVDLSCKMPSHTVTIYFPALFSLILKDLFFPRPCDDFCDNPCGHMFMYCFDPYKFSREVIADFVGGFHWSVFVWNQKFSRETRSASVCTWQVVSQSCSRHIARATRTVGNPLSSSNFSIRAFQAYPLIEIRQAVPCRAPGVLAVWILCAWVGRDAFLASASEKAKRLGGSLGKVGSFSPVPSPHAIGEVGYSMADGERANTSAGSRQQTNFNRTYNNNRKTNTTSQTIHNHSKTTNTTTTNNNNKNDNDNDNNTNNDTYTTNNTNNMLLLLLLLIIMIVIMMLLVIFNIILTTIIITILMIMITMIILNEQYHYYH